MARPRDPTTPGQPPWTSAWKPAPGGLRIVQALVNTVRLETGADELGSPAALAAWLARWRLAPKAELGRAELEQAIAFRETVRAAAGASDVAGAAAIAELNRLAAEIPGVTRLVPGGTARFEPLAQDFKGALGRLLGIVAAARIAGLWPRFKVCNNEACRAAFYDFSKNRAGKWCSMRRCGNRLNARRYQRRRRLKWQQYLRRQAAVNAELPFISKWFLLMNSSCQRPVGADPAPAGLLDSPAKTKRR